MNTPEGRICDECKGPVMSTEPLTEDGKDRCFACRRKAEVRKLLGDAVEATKPPWPINPEAAAEGEAWRGSVEQAPLECPQCQRAIAHSKEPAVLTREDVEMAQASLREMVPAFIKRIGPVYALLDWKYGRGEMAFVPNDQYLTGTAEKLIDGLAQAIGQVGFEYATGGINVKITLLEGVMPEWSMWMGIHAR